MLYLLISIIGIQDYQGSKIFVDTDIYEDAGRCLKAKDLNKEYLIKRYQGFKVLSMEVNCYPKEVVK